MSVIWDLIRQHWLSLLLAIGALVSVYYVYKDKKKILYTEDTNE